MSQNHTAFITGASAGIGRDYARLLASRGYNLILTARRVDRLNELKDELTQAFGIEVTCFPDDLADPKAPRRIADKIEAAGLRVDYLVNNAGYSVPGYFRDVRWDVERDMIQVMVTAVAEFTHIFGPDMAKRGFGRIVNIASAAAYLNGSAGATLYSAVKSFVNRFSQSLDIEYRGTGVNIVSICPGFTYSEFHDVAGNRETMNKLPRFVWLTGPRIVRDAHEAVEAGKGPVIISGWVYKLTALAMRILPENMMTRRSKKDSRNLVPRPEDTHAAAPNKQSSTKKSAAPAKAAPAKATPAKATPAKKVIAAKKPATQKRTAKPAAKPAAKKPAAKKPAAKKPVAKPAAKK